MEGRFLGKVEGVARGRVIGWAWDREAGRAPALRIELNGTLAGELVPDKVIPALAKAGLGDGRAGFAWAVPPGFCDPAPQHLRLPAAEDGSLIFEHAAAKLTTAAEELFRAWKQEALGQGLWALESVAEEAEQLSGTGWAVPPYARPQPMRLLVNGTPARMTWLRRPAPELVDALGLAGRYEAPRFRFALPLAQAGDPALRHLSLTDARGRVLAPGQDVWLSAAAVPQPPEPLRLLSQRGTDAAGFDRSGSSTAQLLLRALARHVKGGVAALGTVLDWGCGAARVGRYLLPVLGRRYLGVDPDAAAIAWCREALPEGRFEVSPAAPPLAFATGTIDCVLGIAVFTRLDEARQLLWLEELARVLRPGALGLFTTFGRGAWVAAARRPAEFLRWRRQGLAELAPGRPGEAVMSHGIGYIQRVWTRHFEMIDVQEGGIGGYQDLIIMRKRAQ